MISAFPLVVGVFAGLAAGLVPQSIGRHWRIMLGLLAGLCGSVPLVAESYRDYGWRTRRQQMRTELTGIASRFSSCWSEGRCELDKIDAVMRWGGIYAINGRAIRTQVFPPTLLRLSDRAMVLVLGPVNSPGEVWLVNDAGAFLIATE